MTFLQKFLGLKKISSIQQHNNDSTTADINGVNLKGSFGVSLAKTRFVYCGICK